MNKRERIESALRLEKPDRVPFAPAIYEHKASLIGKSPSDTCRNAEYLYLSLKQELAVYGPDVLVVGIDVYNVEAEAMGCCVTYFEDSNDCPAIVDPLISSICDLSGIHVPEAESEGRMPLFLSVAGALHRELGRDVLISGAVSGPYTMAATLLGTERFALATIEEVSSARRLLSLCAQATVSYARAFLERGVEPVIFDSRATPLLASPRVFREVVKPLYRDFIFPELKAAGGRFLPLIIGGDTTSILADLIETGATQLLCDPPSNLDRFLEACRNAGVPFRANIEASLVNCGTPAEIERRALGMLELCSSFPGFILGCGIAGYDCPPDRILAIRQGIERYPYSSSRDEDDQDRTGHGR